jgi:hypothetical protein
MMFTASFLLLVSLSYADTVTPGTTIDQHNWQVAEQVLPPEILRPLQAGEFVITVQETTDFPIDLTAPRKPIPHRLCSWRMRITGYTVDGPFH